MLNEEASLAYAGDLFVRKESEEELVVEIGRYEWEFSSWIPEARLGVLVLEPEGVRIPRVELAPLLEEHAKLIWKG